jgi:hypothetical protein
MDELFEDYKRRMAAVRDSCAAAKEGWTKPIAGLFKKKAEKGIIRWDLIDGMIDKLQAKK